MQSDAFTPAVGVSGTERWIAAWVSGEPNGIDVSAHVQVFEGEIPLAPPQRLNQETFGYYSDVRAATSPLGGSVVMWLADYDRTIEPVVRGRLVSREGALVGSELGVASANAGPQFLCDVAMDSTGRFVVAWEQSDPQAEGGVNLYARRFDSAGIPLGEPFRVPTESAGAQYDCDLAMNREGDFVVAWKHDLGTSLDLEDLYVRAFRADGSAYGPAVRVDEPRPPDLFWLTGHPSVSINDAGVFVVAWEGKPSSQVQQIFARKFVLPCSPSATSLCLSEGRFRVHTDWWVRDERTRDGSSLPIRDETGGFWFFAVDNPEVIVKVLDGCGSNGHHWVYAAGLTDVEVHLSVTDTETGEIWARVNPWQTGFAPLQDIEALAGCPDGRVSLARETRPQPSGGSFPSHSRSFSAGRLPVGGESCSPDSTTLRLADGRFEMAATFQSWTGGAIPASAVSLTAESGMFWFFAPENLELFVKIVDACAEFDHFWMFAAGLTNLGVELTVRDLWADETEVYPSAVGTAFPLIRDTGRFATCAAQPALAPAL